MDIIDLHQAFGHCQSFYPKEVCHESVKSGKNLARFTSLLAFLNFVKNNLDPDFTNQCNSPMLRKLFRVKVKTHWDILEKDTVDEIIFRTTKHRDRLLLELMARGAIRIGEVLKIVPNDIAERKILLAGENC